MEIVDDNDFPEDEMPRVVKALGRQAAPIVLGMLAAIPPPVERELNEVGQLYHSVGLVPEGELIAHQEADLHTKHKIVHEAHLRRERRKAKRMRTCQDGAHTAACKQADEF